MTRRYAWVLLAWLLAAAPAHAQPVDSGSIVANSSGGGCTVTPPACVVITFSNQLITTIVLQVSGTYTGTLAFEATSSANPLATSAVWFSITGTNLADVSTATGTTSTGQFSFPNSGLMGIRARATAWTSGTASISAVRGYAVARGGSSPFGLPIPALASGTCVTPSYTFTGDTDSGIGWLGANNIAGCAGGATIFDWNASRFRSAVPFVGPAGSSAATSFNFGTAGTGLYGSSAAVNFAVNGDHLIGISSAGLLPSGNNVYPLGATGTRWTTGWFGTSVVSPILQGSGTGVSVANVGANSCGTTAATIAGNQLSGVITVGTVAGTQCRVTFSTAAPVARDCTVTDSTTTIATRATVVSTTTHDFFGAFVAGDQVTYICTVR